MSQITLYKTNAGNIKVLLDGEDIWMNQEQIAELFEKSRNTITEHINNIYSDGELKEQDTMRKLSNVGNSDIGFVKPTQYYNLDLVFAV